MITLTDGIAIYAGIVSTIVLLWDIVKWRMESAPQILVKVSPNMFMIDGFGKKSARKISFTATNIGTRVTTINNITGFWYKNYFNFWRRKADAAFVVANPVLTQPIPYKLEPGSEWMGGMNQDEFMQEYNRGYLVLGVHHTLSQKPIERVLNVSEILQSSKSKTSK